MRVRFCRAWQALPEAEKGNVVYSDETMFTLQGSTNRQNQRRYAVPEHKGGTGRPPSLQIDQHHYDKKLMVFLCSKILKPVLEGPHRGQAAKDCLRRLFGERTFGLGLAGVNWPPTSAFLAVCDFWLVF